jgi:hypothetical protein
VAKFPADEIHVETATLFLRKQRKLAHLRVRKRGDTIIIESGPKNDPVAHARLRRVTGQSWTLEMPSHVGRWEPTPISAPLQQALTTLVQQFPWTLTPIA